MVDFMPFFIPDFQEIQDAPQLPEVQRVFAAGTRQLIIDEPSLGEAEVDRHLLGNACEDDISLELMKGQTRTRFGGVTCVVSKVVPPHLLSPDWENTEGAVAADYPIGVEYTERILAGAARNIQIFSVQWGYAQRYAMLMGKYEKSLRQEGGGNILKIQRSMERLEQRFEEVIRALQFPDAA